MEKDIGKIDDIELFRYLNSLVKKDDFLVSYPGHQDDKEPEELGLVETGNGPNPYMYLLGETSEPIEGEGIVVPDCNVAEIIDEEIGCVPEARYLPVLSSLASVGIVSERFEVEPKFFPHGREFYVLPNLGEFTYLGETVEHFYFPTLGAEKFTRNVFQSVAVATTQGVVASGVYTDVIDAARSKIDGDETVVYQIETRSYRASFVWSGRCHRKMDRVVPPGHFEYYQDVYYFLSGYNSLDAVEHEWYYLTDLLIDQVRSGEGIIVRMSGKEYRIPWQHTATFLVRKGRAMDYTGKISFETMAPDGLFDFCYEPGSGKWFCGKYRKDKNRADSATGIYDMLNRTCCLSVFLQNVAIGKGLTKAPREVVVVGLEDLLSKRVIYSPQLDLVRVRLSGSFKQPDSYRRCLLEDTGGKKISTYNVSLHRSNLVLSSGRVVLFRRHERSKIYHIGDRSYVTDYMMGSGKVITIRLRHPVDGSIHDMGPVLRVYSYDYWSLKGWTRKVGRKKNV